MPTCETLESLDARIRMFEAELAELADLKEQRNSLARACSVPSEILVDIFKLVQHRVHNYDENRPWNTFDRNWDRVMIVCRRFRDVAAQAAVLWSYIDYEDHSPEYRALCFQRSGTHNLCIYDSNGSSAVEYFPMARVRSVVIDRVGRSELLQFPAPHLRYFELYYGFNEDGDRIDVNNSLLGGMNLQLLNLSLRGVYARQVPVMSSLRRLVFDWVFMPGGPDVLRHLFEQIPVIEEVCLANCMVLLPPEYFQTRPSPVDLPYLQSLCIVGEPDVVSACLCILPLPRLAMGLQVKLSTLPETEDAYLRPDHAHIFQNWLDFTKHQSEAAGLTEGTLIRTSDRPVIVHYGGDEVPCNDFSCRSPSFCHISCLLSGPHPVLDPVTAFHLVDNTELDARHEPFDRSLDEDLQACVLPNVQDLLVEGSAADLAHPDVVPAIMRWILNQSNRIRRVRFLGCNTVMWTLAEELQQQQLVPVVSWEIADQPEDS
jgi:hypothetical protein